VTDIDRAEVKIAVKEAVSEQLPETLAEVLAPMTRHDARAVLTRYRNMAVVGWVVSAVALALLYYNVQHQADYNTRQNHRQDCILSGLLRGVEEGDPRPDDHDLFDRALSKLDPGSKCPRLVIPAPSSTP
jgi:hypothetical protein